MKSFANLFFIVFILFMSCTSRDQAKKETPTFTSEISESSIIIADTIINDILIKNANDDEWVDYCLRKLDKKTLVNEIFQMVYDGKLIPYEFFSETTLSIDDIKELEKDPSFSRDKIAKLQFEEAWYFDTDHQTMMKKVHSIMLAFEIYNSEGEIKGYKPAFKVFFK